MANLQAGDRVVWEPRNIPDRPEVLLVLPGKPHHRTRGTRGTIVAVAYGLLGVRWDDGTQTAIYTMVRPAIVAENDYVP